MTLKKQVRALCVVFHNIMLHCGMWLDLHANEWQETSNATGSCVGSVTVHDEEPDSELPFTLFDVTLPGLAAVKVDTLWQLTSHPNLTKKERETVESL